MIHKIVSYLMWNPDNGALLNVIIHIMERGDEYCAIDVYVSLSNQVTTHMYAGFVYDLNERKYFEEVKFSLSLLASLAQFEQPNKIVDDILDTVEGMLKKWIVISHNESVHED